MTNLEDNFTKLQARINMARTKHAERTKNVRLLAVSKRHSADKIRQLYALGQMDFGENYLQEALAKQVELADLPLGWHFIGSIQKNKTRDIANHFDWVHSVDRSVLIERLADQRPPDRDPLNICLQVNIDNEASKSGFQVAELAAACELAARKPSLRLRGLMAIPSPAVDAEQRLASMQAMKRCWDNLIAQGSELDTLSMGMSADLEIAIQAGATMLRVGEALFGPREA